MLKGIKSPALLSNNSMIKCKIFLLMFLFMVFSYIHLYGDIVVTYDDMILNGKILEDKKDDYIKFGNYHGTFTIDYRQIKEIHRTERFEDDVKIFKEKGRRIDEAEVKTNYQAGLEKLEKQKSTGKKIIKKDTITNKIQARNYTLLLSPFFNINGGTIGTMLPYSFGVSVIGDIRLDQFYNLKNFSLTGVRAEIGYYHAVKREKSVIGTRASAGPLWSFPMSIGSIGFDYTISPVIGLGRYSIKGDAEKADALKWNFAIITGPVLDISAIFLAPLIRFDYIYDGRMPLYGIGFSIGAGFRF